MKGLTLIQPWATLIVEGRKRYETRSWSTPYRGLVAIHAGKKIDRRFAGELWTDQKIATDPIDLPTGAIIAIAEVVGMHSTGSAMMPGFVPEPPERWYGDYSPNRWAWELANIKVLDTPIPCKGSLGLWALPDDIVPQLSE